MSYLKTSVIFMCLILDFGYGIKVFEIQNSHPNGVNGGDKVTLKCTSNSKCIILKMYILFAYSYHFLFDSFDFCAWKHAGKSCNFKYGHLGHFRKLSSACIGDNSMINFVGSLSAHECKIELHNISSSDNGTWSCFMQNSMDKSNDSSQIELLVKKKTEEISSSTTRSWSSSFSPKLSGSSLDADATELPSALWNDDDLNQSELITTEDDSTNVDDNQTTTEEAEDEEITTEEAEEKGVTTEEVEEDGITNVSTLMNKKDEQNEMTVIEFERVDTRTSMHQQTLIKKNCFFSNFSHFQVVFTTR